jgi:DNA-binding NtrC family response regulator
MLPADFHPGLAERIGATIVDLPPLRERNGDIPALARHFLGRLTAQGLTGTISINDEALALLMRYGWPGNVRQLAGVLFRAALQRPDGPLGAEDFPHIAIQSRFTNRQTDRVPRITAAGRAQALAGSGNVTLYSDDGHLRALEDIEADIIRLAIGHYRGRMSEVARRLKIGRSTLYRKLGDLGIDTAA